MALYTNRNLGPYSSGDESIYALKDWLTSGHGGTQHWSVKSSGDGLSAYNGAGDVITSSSSGANGLGNNNAWFVLTDPDTTRELLIQRSSNSYQWRFLYSRAAGFTGGNATTAPTAADQQGWGSADYTTDQRVFPSSGVWMTHICAEGNAAEGNVWTFWCVSRSLGSGSTVSFIMCDAVKNAYSPNVDSDKVILIATDNNLNYNSGAYLSRMAVSHLVGYMRYGEADEAWDHIVALYLGAYGFSASEQTIVPGGLGVNEDSSEYGTFPILYARLESSGVDGVKGQSFLMRWNSSGGTKSGDIIQVSTDYYLAIDHVLLKGWPDSTSPRI